MNLKDLYVDPHVLSTQIQKNLRVTKNALSNNYQVTCALFILIFK